jgi:hypothetical protein
MSAQDGLSAHEELQAEVARLRQVLSDLIERVERDLREPDKLLCAVLSARSAAL